MGITFLLVAIIVIVAVSAGLQLQPIIKIWAFRSVPEASEMRTGVTWLPATELAANSVIAAAMTAVAKQAIEESLALSARAAGRSGENDAQSILTGKKLVCLA